MPEPAQQQQQVRVKARCGQEVRRFEAGTWAALYDAVRTVFAVPEGQGFMISYLDDEGDRVVFNTQAEFEEAVRWGVDEGTLLIDVARDPPPSALSERKVAEAVAALQKRGHAWAGVQRLRQLVGRFGGDVDAAARWLSLCQRKQRGGAARGQRSAQPQRPPARQSAAAPGPAEEGEPSPSPDTAEPPAAP
eukprot:TRINITY_DN60244_c0_g1_i1.p2 TRINITY_DN60244_c0_g1~~TRINITY_DN60244_c0_g1_i1.p2  ORF type:complete len:214 (+),score=81.80 TRINITY_DN60244_c0_g1_i1:70-642(+)